MNHLNISLIQSELHWENPKANREMFERKINELAETDLILLPEMFTTGFSMQSEKLAEQMEGESIEWMQRMASSKQAVICGSMIIEEEGNYYNRLLWVEKDGSVKTYDKRHLFRMANEDDYFKPGKEKLIVELKGWKICPMVCYDLRFPVYSRNRYQTDRSTYAKAEYDLLFYIANWPAARSAAWRKLLYARAIENQVYVAGLNRIGKDGKDIDYDGSSMVLDAKGEEMWQAKLNAEDQVTITLDLDELNAFRKKFPLGMDADEFTLE